MMKTKKLFFLVLLTCSSCYSNCWGKDGIDAILNNFKQKYADDHAQLASTTVDKVVASNHHFFQDGFIYFGPVFKLNAPKVKATLWRNVLPDFFHKGKWVVEDTASFRIDALDIFDLDHEFNFGSGQSAGQGVVKAMAGLEYERKFRSVRSYNTYLEALKSSWQDLFFPFLKTTAKGILAMHQDELLSYSDYLHVNVSGNLDVALPYGFFIGADAKASYMHLKKVEAQNIAINLNNASEIEDFLPAPYNLRLSISKSQKVEASVGARFGVDILEAIKLVLVKIDASYAKETSIDAIYLLPINHGDDGLSAEDAQAVVTDLLKIKNPEDYAEYLSDLYKTASESISAKAQFLIFGGRFEQKTQEENRYVVTAATSGGTSELRLMQKSFTHSFIKESVVEAPWGMLLNGLLKTEAFRPLWLRKARLGSLSYQGERDILHYRDDYDILKGFDYIMSIEEENYLKGGFDKMGVMKSALFKRLKRHAPIQADDADHLQQASRPLGAPWSASYHLQVDQYGLNNFLQSSIGDLRKHSRALCGSNILSQFFLGCIHLEKQIDLFFKEATHRDLTGVDVKYCKDLAKSSSGGYFSRRRVIKQCMALRSQKEISINNIPLWRLKSIIMALSAIPNPMQGNQLLFGVPKSYTGALQMSSREGFPFIYFLPAPQSIPGRFPASSL